MAGGKMFEGKVIKVVHPSGEIKNGIIAGCDEKKGITVISADKPDDILFAIPSKHRLTEKCLDGS